MKINKLTKKNKKIENEKKQKNILIPLTISTISFFIVIILILIFKTKQEQAVDTSVSVSKLDTQYIIVKDKDGNKEYKLSLKPAMAKSLGFPATPVTPEITITINTQQSSLTPTVTTSSSDSLKEKKDFFYLFEPVDSKEKIHRIDIDAAKFLFDSGKALFVDARPLQEYEEAHIKGAIPIPLNMLEENIKKYKDKMKDKVLVTYCHGIGCRLSDRVAYTLFDNGFRKICIFFSGWPKWVEHNYPIEKK